MFKRIRIRTNIMLHFLFILLTLSLVLITAQYYFSKEMAKEAMGRDFDQTAHSVALKLRERDRLSKEMLYQIESHPSIHHLIREMLPMETIQHFTHTLERYDTMYAIYLGYGNGDFFEVVNMKIDPSLYTHYDAPQKTRWTIIKIYDTAKGRERLFLFLDENYKVVGSREESSSYNATERPWYRDAIQVSRPIRSDPYLFSNLQQKGITYAKKLRGSDTVLALDFTLESMHQMLLQLPFARHGDIYLFGRDSKLISSSLGGKRGLTSVLKHLIEEKKIHTIETLHKEDKTYYAMIVPLSKEMGKETYIAVTMDKNELLAPYRKYIYYALLIALFLLLMFIPLALYLTDHIVKPIKALMEENEMIKQRRFDAVKPVETNIIEFIELSDSQINMSKSIQSYQKQLEDLLDSFIKLIADAIDAKSAYTGSHCKKVPVIASMLAKAAEESTKVPFETFRFEDEEHQKAFERAAWLHDCGKITTPEYVVDKATKLETIYNRIHEIRTRFEVLWRDVEIRYYERLLAGEDESELKKWRKREHQTLQEDFAFIAVCNQGVEFMEDKALERIGQIAQRTWMRHFDDTRGLSEEERSRYPGTPAPLPAEERLIDDKIQHLIPRENFDINEYRREHFKLEVPTWLYNRGELYNLCIQKGTLTKEERYKINEHVIMTIKMLERLPFPENMSQIPKIAGEHHETMDGKGYPRSLTRDELSIPSRIMAIADIFEALTASDRPYKKAKTLSEALKIMYTMKKENHIDADLFDLFITSGVYMTYARNYLHPEQIDEVDEKELLR